MKIQSLDRSVGHILGEGYYRIPRFQRPFSWERDQVEEFWADSIAENETDYFIGSMVVYKENENTLGVVDGQQRLTTIAMMLCALRNAFDKNDFPEDARGIHDNVIERRNISNKPEFVLQCETSYPYLQEHIQKFGSPDTQAIIGEEEKLLKLAFEIIADFIQQAIDSVLTDSSISEEAKKEGIHHKLISIRTKILGLKIIYIILDNEDDAYVIFETLNSRGRNLTVADLVKNHLLKLIRPKTVNVDIQKDKWNSIVQMVDDIGSKDIAIDDFLYHQWLSKYERYVPAK